MENSVVLPCQEIIAESSGKTLLLNAYSIKWKCVWKKVKIKIMPISRAIQKFLGNFKNVPHVRKNIWEQYIAISERSWPSKPLNSWYTTKFWKTQITFSEYTHILCHVSGNNYFTKFFHVNEISDRSPYSDFLYHTWLSLWCIINPPPKTGIFWGWV